jgi:hypothetical protein
MKEFFVVTLFVLVVCGGPLILGVCLGVALSRRSVPEPKVKLPPC